jgi:ribosomal protein L21
MINDDIFSVFVPGDKVSMDKVLLIGTANETKLGQPLVKNAYVEVVVEQQTLSDKVIPPSSPLCLFVGVSKQ